MVHTYIFITNKSQKWMSLGTGNPGWSCRQPEIVYYKSWWLTAKIMCTMQILCMIFDIKKRG